MTALTRSTDRKVTNSVTKSGNPRIANAFGIPAGVSCPGMTSFCEKICYARKLERIYKGVSKSVIANFETLLYADYLDGIKGMQSLIFDMVDEFDKECDRKKADKADQMFSALIREMHSAETINGKRTFNQKIRKPEWVYQTS